jgi:membrane protease subunit HflK
LAATISCAGERRDASLLTHDADIVDVRFAVQYQVRSATDYLFRSVDPDQSVTLAAQAAVRGIVGSRSTDDLLYQDREALPATDRRDPAFPGRIVQTGLVVTGVTIQGVQAPEQVQAAFDDAAKAHQDRERARADAQAYANELLPHAQADAARLVDQAKGYSNQVVSQAQGDAERFKQVYEQYSKAPAVIRERMYLDTMQHIYSNTTKVFVDSKAGNNVMYLPLDKLVDATRQRTAEAAAASAGSGSAAGSAAAANQGTPGAQGAQGVQGTQDSQGASNSVAPAAAASAAAAASPASEADAASDPLRSRDAFRSRGREDDIQ